MGFALHILFYHASKGPTASAERDIRMDFGKQRKDAEAKSLRSPAQDTGDL
jgi:hypothetical protein